MSRDDDASCYDCVGGKKSIIGLSIFGLAVFLTAVLVGVSYHGLNHDKYGLDKNTIKNDVNTNEVYYRGNNYLGVSHEFVEFPATYQQVSFSDGNRLSVASKNGLEFGLNCDFQYRLRRESVGHIFKEFSTNYHSQVLTRATAAIKEVTPLHETSDFFRKRIEVQDALWIAIRDELDELGMDVPEHKFQLGHPDFSPLIDSQNLNAAVQEQTNIKEGIQQEATLTADTTTQMVALIEANATRVEQEADAISDSLIVQANAEANRIRENAKTAGLEVIFTRFNVSNKAHFLKFVALTNGHNVKLLDNVESLVKTSEVV